MLNSLSGILPIYLMTEYQKSGGSWIGQMVSDYLELPFPRNRIPAIRSCVLHGHIMPTQYLRNVLCVFRDGRDTLVSSYYHMLFESDKNSPALVRKTKEILKFSDYDNVKENLPKFTEYLFTQYHIRSLARWNQFTWAEFVDAWRDEKIVKLKYEDAVANTTPVMAQAIKNLTGGEVDVSKLQIIVDKYSFENQTKRKPGQEDTKSFLRKGQPGDWKEKFTKETAELFDHYAGTQLIAMDYEKDRAWIETLK